MDGNLAILQAWLKDNDSVSEESNRLYLWDELIGEVITSIIMSEDYLCIDVVGKRLVWSLDADCCSHTWFADAVGMQNVINQRVISVQSIDLDDYDTNDNRGTQEYDQVYGYRIRTQNGNFVFSFRNSSNGYYGGDIEKSRCILLPGDAVDISDLEFWQS